MTRVSCIQLWLWVFLGLAAPVAAQPELKRGLLSHDVIHARAGGGLSVLLQTGSGLTPPPGVQQERALRGFAARLCPRAAHAPAQSAARCTPIEPRDVRPRDAHSLAYRVHFALPRVLPAGHYDLDVRFPGGSDRLADGVAIEPDGLAGGATASPLTPALAGPPVHAPRVLPGCTLGPGRPVPNAWGLLVVALCWKLGRSRARVRRWNSAPRTSVSRGP